MTNNKPKAKNKSRDDFKKNTLSYHHGDLKKALVETGLLVIKEQGSNALSLREAARKAGVSEAAPYRHFANKESLLAAIAEEGFKRLRTRLAEGITTASGDPLAQLHAVAWGYTQFAMLETDHFRVMFSSSLVPPHAEKHPSLSEAAISNFNVLVVVVEDCQKTGIISNNANPKTTAAQLWGSIHGMTLLLIDQEMAFLGMNASQAHDIVKNQLNSHLEGLRNFPKA
jgi:AcrR family transcriptional regulator